MATQVSISTKRKAIADSNRTMFLWIAGMSAVVGFCAVAAIFLVQQIAFHGKVVAELTTTASTLEKNNKAIGELSKNILVYETNEGLNSVKANEDEKALQVILDALPADRNTLALGSSLQQSLLTGVDGITIESIVVDGATDGESTSEDATTTVAKVIPVQIKLTATNASAVKDMLARLEKSIRVIDIDGLTLETGDGSYTVTIAAHAYYQPAVSVELKDKVVKP